MKANELMIGDWVFNSHHNKPIQITPYDFFTHSHKDGVQSFEGIQNPKPTLGGDLSPIPLTAEILEKNGFTLKKADKYFPKDGYIWFDSIENNELVEIYIYDKPINGVRVLTKITNDCKAHGGVNKVHCCEIENAHELQHALRLCGIDKTIEI